MSTGCIIGLIVGIVGAVVLVLVAILAAIAVPVGQKVLEKARILQIEAAMKGLEVAIKGYQIEYTRLPDLGETDEEKTLEVQGEMLDIIMGKHPGQNPRQIAFFDAPPPSSRTKGGLVTNAAGQPELQDVFGNVYHMRFDWNGDGSIPDPEHPAAVVTEPVIFYSAGPDGDYTTWGDNVKSWGP